MKKYFCFILVVLSLNNVMAQQFNPNVLDAITSMESAINSSQQEFTMQDSYYLGRTVAAIILGRYGLYAEKANMINYLNLICSALAINSPSPNWYNGYKVMVLNDPAPNAFSTPGGHIFITRGLIELAVSEDMLAAIIAHEMAHIQLEHGIAEIMNTRVIQGLIQDQQRVSRSVDNEIQRQLFSESVSGIVESLLGRGYSQLQEFEADSAAINILIASGYNPAAFLDLLRIFERLQRNQAGNLNNTHPLPAQRITNLQGKMPHANRNVNNSSARMNRFNQIMR